MDGDLSLSQSLGGLRVTNPSPSPPPHAPETLDATLPARPTPSSSHSSSSTITDSHPKRSSSFLPPPSLPPPSLPADPQQPPGALGHRQSMPLDLQAQQQPQYSRLPPSALSQARNIAVQQSSPRPSSAIYNHTNLSGSSGFSGRSGYRYREEPIHPSAPSGPGIDRSSSRISATGGSAGIPSRHSSVRGGSSYRQSQQITPLNGQVPPRRAHASSGSSPPHPPHSAGTPYALEGGPMPSSEEWKERGAAVSVRREVDADGNVIQKSMKKGVKDFNFGTTLGEGSYSTVTRATDRQTLREYAIKILDKRHIIKEKKVKYVNIEKDALNRLTEHPGIVRLYYTFQDERSLYFVLDLANNGELLGVLKKMGTFSEECTRFYGAQILDAIEYMHSRGVVHRDLKPENVLLDENFHVKITDFGTAKLLSLGNPGEVVADPLDTDTGRTKSFVGTAEYVSPELLTDKVATKPSDLWAFGCIIYQLLAGRPPFKAAGEWLTFQKIVNLDYSFPEGFPDVAKDLVERLLVVDPMKRLPIEHIKNHQFFDGIKWGKGLWKQKAPRLKSYSPPAPDPIRLNGPAASSATIPQLRPQPRVITELPPPSQLDLEWSPLLTRTNERILKLGNLIVTKNKGPFNPNSTNGESAGTPKKFSRFFSASAAKRRQRLVMVTSSARIVLAPAGGSPKEPKGELSLLSPQTYWRSFQDSKGLTAWCVDMSDKHVIFEDPNATTKDPDGSKYSTQEWLEACEQAKDLAISQSVTNSYSGDSALNFGSSISSPTSTLGGGESLEGVDIPSAGRHLGRQPGDAESTKSKKHRFSKRHSKNGLAAVF